MKLGKWVKAHRFRVVKKNGRRVVEYQNVKKRKPAKKRKAKKNTPKRKPAKKNKARKTKKKSSRRR